ncbi:Outer membrane receptor proteins, mostly Fe transport [Porphyromonadaceae bacterium KH3R12]|uniref:carboxypeptidase-like regulatory domain-containing protein n=1 Tax=Proteiniphilum saccharofermentans TaxID=1642647 RepID=UPI0008941E42|nr:carboxypeptidase-like regulatory domain-containing protein [Proteiniphilum saccharofermentans]SEA01510.1 Outer membrane receptor proteins, mostly Fe transport [Porphyromonadaceae bacterium KH3R12]
MRFFCFWILIFCFSIGVAAQTLKISGTVTDKTTGEPMVGVLVTLRPAGENKVVKFAQTSPQGKFEIALPSFPENHVLHFSMMGYAVQTIPLIAGREQYNVQLSEQATELKEVIVKAPSIHQRGDTITYVVSSFAAAQDKSLADVLKKMPGIEVDKSGSIKYNGVSINKFYIEGKDMLGGRYGIATTNIHQKDVGSVEVMENHQPVKALEDISFSQNPGINIRLKEDAKARWVGTVKAGAGFTPFLWNAETALMRFKKQSQTLSTYKTNNTGHDLTRETMWFSIDEILSQFSKNYLLQDYISVAPSRLREIDADRSRFNKTHLFTTNNLWSLGKNYDLTSQITYTNNRLKSENSTRTTYFLEDSTVITELAEHAVSKQNRLSGDVTLTANTPTYYFKNKLFTDLRWDDVDMDITGTFPNTQTASVPHRQVSNDFEILKRSGKKAYTLNSYNLYQVKPQALTVSRENETQHQQIQSSVFYTNTYTSLSFYVKPVTISMKLGAVGVIRSLETALTGVSDTLGSLKNDVLMRYLNLYVSPEVEYRKSGLEAKFDMPLSFVPYRFTDNLDSKNRNEEKFFASPRLYMRYHFTSRLSASLSGRYGQSPLQEQSFHEGLILNNYHNLSQGFIDYKTGNSQSVNLNVSYRYPLKVFFANVGVARSRTYALRISNRYFLNEYLLNTFIAQPSRSDSWMLNGNISKGVYFINGIVSVRSLYSAFDGALFQNGKESPYSSDSWSITPKITSRIARWCNVSYELSFSRNWLKMKNSDMQTSYKNLSQLFSCSITPHRTWYVQLAGEHYYNEITQDVSKHLFLADAEFTYSFKSGWELNLSVKNIFNQHLYAYTVYNGLTAMSREYKIRPRNVMAGVFFRF